ncbi:MAG: hypothetical protein M3Y74_19490, partial [Chloroflexota bacterium]|nr:hypothetical protein [Chloroflexota bacterium]
MRPSPRDVRRWFAHRGTMATVAAHLTTLHADPNWRVRYTRGVSLHTFSLLYSPHRRVHRDRGAARRAGVLPPPR